MITVTKKVLSVLNPKQKRFVFVLAFLMLIGGLLESVSATMILPLVTTVVDANSWSESWYAKLICKVFHIRSQYEYEIVALLLLIILFFIKNIYLLFEQYVQSSFITKSKFSMQRSLIHSYLYKPYSFYLSSNSGDIVRVITSDTNQLFNSLTRIILFFTELVTCGFLFVTMLLVSPRMAIGIILVVLFELIIIMYILRPKIRKYGELQRSCVAKGNMWILQAIQGIKSIKVTVKEKFFEDMYCKYAYTASDCDRKFHVFNSAVSRIVEAVTIMGALIVILIMVLAGNDLKNIIPELAVFAMAAVRILPSINRISQSYTTIHFSEGGVNNILRAINDDNAKVSVDSQSFPERAASKMDFKREICFDNVAFRYPTGETEILQNASFSIHPGEAVGIIGASGAGKTTVVDILLGLLEPTNGRITVDGVDIRNNMPGWLGLLAYVPQSIFVSNDSIRDNIAFGEEESSIRNEKIWEALDEAQLGDFVRTLPEGLDTKVGEAGIRLSGGQIQRIGIARALYRNPQIIFFDEATSSLDNETESAVLDTIKSLKGIKTLIIVAHRLSTIQNCDTIYRVADNKISRV